ncbi:hypothetical protein [Chitinilyticum litopenaei]|uniref:hypothetical protein n=1 Tax=Chitinilyticum litopenaei TaxID=1121276 RepID=UPI000413BEE6|nr:hypothetical protein [Chitinilyticum litopenaei]
MKHELWATTFIPDATGLSGVFSVIPVAQLQKEHRRAFAAHLEGDRVAYANRLEMVLFVGSNDACHAFCAGAKKMRASVCPEWRDE